MLNAIAIILVIYFVVAAARVTAAVDALVMVKGAMWDVKNEYLYLTASVEGEAKKIGPAFLLENGESIREARDKAIENFGSELVRRLKALKGIPLNPVSERTR